MSAAISGKAAQVTSPNERAKPPGGRPPLRVCLAGSGGGHVRQLLDLEPAWAPHDYFFVSEDTALSRSIAEKHPMRFVSHFALGQARLGKPWKMATSALRNFLEAGKIMLKERPDVLITTGAGAVFWSVVWARMTGTRIVLVESFARFHPRRCSGGSRLRSLTTRSPSPRPWPRTGRMPGSSTHCGSSTAYGRPSDRSCLLRSARSCLLIGLWKWSPT